MTCAVLALLELGTTPRGNKVHLALYGQIMAACGYELEKLHFGNLSDITCGNCCQTRTFAWLQMEQRNEKLLDMRSSMGPGAAEFITNWVEGWRTYD